MSNLAVHFSSKTDDWATPQWLFDELNAKYGPFVLDVCATPNNTKCRLFYNHEVGTDGLQQDWNSPLSYCGEATPCWMNPPYGREIGKWVKKAYEESQKGCLVVCLLPARTDTQWFHSYCTKGEVTFIKGRLKFGNATNSAPFPSMIVVFRPAK